MKWYESAIFYHIYPLGFCGCELENNYESPVKSRILKVTEAISHIKSMGFNAVYFGPVFESVKHGYDTADYSIIDRRLGTNSDFAAVCEALRNNGIKVVVDGVFNHVGRDFWAFKDVIENKFNSRYKDWFFIRDGQSNYNDGFYYEGWEGHFELVKLNLRNDEVKNYLFECIEKWINEFDIDGIRLDVAYCLDMQFLKDLRKFCDGKKSDFWLMGETLHGDYNVWMNDETLHSVTNYECYKGIHSSFNELNLYEIAYSLNRQFGPDPWTLYKGKLLYNFVENHDVSRIATILKTQDHLPLAYTVLFMMPGIPSVYYGGEFGFTGDKKDGDNALRPKFEGHDDNEITDFIKKLAKIRKNNPYLSYGGYRQVYIKNKQLAFSRFHEDKQLIIGINAGESEAQINLNMAGEGVDILSGRKLDLTKDIEMSPCSAFIVEKQD